MNGAIIGDCAVILLNVSVGIARIMPNGRRYRNDPRDTGGDLTLAIGSCRGDLTRLLLRVHCMFVFVW